MGMTEIYRESRDIAGRTLLCAACCVCWTSMGQNNGIEGTLLFCYLFVSYVLVPHTGININIAAVHEMISQFCHVFSLL